MKNVLLILFLALPLFAEDKAKDVPPQLSAEMQILIWRSQSDLYSTRLTLERSQQWQASQKAEAAWNNAVTEWKQTCGDAYEPGIDKAGSPVCVAKPKAPAQQAK